MTKANGLERFVEAQAPTYATALTELRNGRKESHWMWFVFPQIAGLGSSAMARHYAIESREEAEDYAAHPLLGPRLAACTEAVLAHAGAPARVIFGSVDAMKFRSSMTLFDAAAGQSQPLFAQALAAFFEGEPDPATLRLLG